MPIPIICSIVMKNYLHGHVFWQHDVQHFVQKPVFSSNLTVRPTIFIPEFLNVCQKADKTIQKYNLVKLGTDCKLSVCSTVLPSSGLLVIRGASPLKKSANCSMGTDMVCLNADLITPVKGYNNIESKLYVAVN